MARKLLTVSGACFLLAACEGGAVENVSASGGPVETSLSATSLERNVDVMQDGRSSMSSDESDQKNQSNVTLSQVDVVAAHGYTPQEEALVDAAWDSVYQDCLASVGYERVPYTKEADEESHERELSRMLFNDVNLIEEYGYGWLLPTFGAPEPPLLENSVQVDETADQRCKRAANEQLGGSDQELYDVLMNERVELDQQLEVEWVEFDEIKVAWAQCMGEGGFPDESFPSERMMEWMSDIEATTLEIEYALLDYRCRGESGFRDNMIDFMMAQLDDWERENETFILELDKEIDLRVSLAKEILGR